MKINVKGLKFQNWLNLMIFSLIILAVLWALQFLFLGSFYKSMKLNEVKNIGDSIISKFDDTDFHSIMNEYAFKNNLRIILLDESGRITRNFDGFPTDTPGLMPPGGFGMFPQKYISTALKKLRESNSNKTYYLDTDNRFDSTQSVYVAKVSDKNGIAYYLYISSPIPSIDSTISVLKTQFYIITAILFVLALIMAQWISKKMTKPIIRLTKSAERMVKGELDATIYDNDFTEIHQLASALNYATEELRSLDNYRREFIANVSHDLKTPLTIIKLNGELIKDVSGDDPQKREEHCNTIIKEADWLTDMVGEILELSKLETNNADFTKTNVNLSQCLADVLDSFDILKDKKGYFFKTDIDPNLYVYGNEPMIKRVFYNLISNAVNFTGDDKYVYVSLKHADKKVRFAVTDTGEGIPIEKQAAIWDRYYKCKETHKRAVIGTGIGLSIVKSILVLHNAAFGVISEAGNGSTFWFEL